MDHINRQRELLKVSGFVIPGNVYKMHYSIMKFGNPDKPYHFSTNVTEQLDNLQVVTVIPISRERYKPHHFIQLNLKYDSNLHEAENEQLDSISFAIVSLPKQIEVESLFKEPISHLRGKLIDRKTKELLKARKKFINSQFSHSGKGD